jgi:preprotein translocase subunit SecA
MIPGLHAAMVDEADAVLIDEGVVPLIIARSRREDDMAQVYRDAARIAAKLDEGPDYSIDTSTAAPNSNAAGSTAPPDV